MERLTRQEPVWQLKFDERGGFSEASRDALFREVAAEGISDLFVLSHGWGTSETSANQLYNSLFPLISDAAGENGAIDRPGFVGIYWPSLWFPDTPATPPAQSGSIQTSDAAPRGECSGTAALSGGEITMSLSDGFENPRQKQSLQEIGKLIDQGASFSPGETESNKEELLQKIHHRLQSLVPHQPDAEFEDHGELAVLLTKDPRQDYQAASDVFGSSLSLASTEGVGDWFKKAITGAKDILRVFSYTVMKTRAGDIGRTGLGPILADLHQHSPTVRVHLIGHSFGARLVSFALAGIGRADASPVTSLLLIQGAFSHWAFAHAEDNPFGRAGALHTFTDRVHGPLIATFSKYDWAVGRWYPKASFLSHDDTQAGSIGRWDGMGADGYQAVNPSADRTMPSGGGMDYNLAAGTFYRVDAANVINNVQNQPFAGAHSDICKVPVAQLAVAAAQLTEDDSSTVRQSPQRPT